MSSLEITKAWQAKVSGCHERVLLLALAEATGPDGSFELDTEKAKKWCCLTKGQLSAASHKVQKAGHVTLSQDSGVLAGVWGQEKLELSAEPADSPQSSPQEMAQAICNAFGMSMKGSSRTRIGRVAKLLRERDVDPKDVKKARDRYLEKFEGCTCTPEALEKHWDTVMTDLESPAQSADSSGLVPGRVATSKEIEEKLGW